VRKGILSQLRIMIMVYLCVLNLCSTAHSSGHSVALPVRQSRVVLLHVVGTLRNNKLLQMQPLK